MNNTNFGLNKPSIDFEQVRDNRRSLPLWMDIDLTTARSIDAGTALSINIAGDSFYSDQSAIQGIATVHFQDTNLGNSSAPITINPGFIAKVPYTQLLVENEAQPGYRMRVFYGVDIDFLPGTGGQMTVAGAVSVINGELLRVKANACFIGGAAIAGVAAQYSKLQLWNPVGSGKNLILNKISVLGSSAPGLIGIQKTNAALATPGNTGYSKLLSGANGVGQFYQETNAAMPSLGYGNFGVNSANESKDFPFSEPFVIPPGNGVIVFTTIPLVTLYSTFQWNEESI